MRPNPHFELEDPATVKRLIRENPWATIVSATATGLVASHYPILLDEDRPEISILSHVGRPDEELHELGQHEILVIVQGPHGYISSSWYPPGPSVPTWNFVVAHLHGTPELLDPETNLQVLARLVDTFEQRVPAPRPMSRTGPHHQAERQISQGTIGFRLTATRVTAKQKMSQNKPSEVFNAVLAQIDGDGPYADAALAREMRLARPGH